MQKKEKEKEKKKKENKKKDDDDKDKHDDDDEGVQETFHLGCARGRCQADIDPSQSDGKLPRCSGSVQKQVVSK